jgi:uncharacterized protein (TIGR03382 family)
MKFSENSNRSSIGEGQEVKGWPFASGLGLLLSALVHRRRNKIGLSFQHKEEFRPW